MVMMGKVAAKAVAAMTERRRHQDPSEEHGGSCLWLLLLLVGPNSDVFGGQAFMEHYSVRTSSQCIPPSMPKAQFSSSLKRSGNTMGCLE
jgi:hypothetical protein